MMSKKIHTRILSILLIFGCALCLSFQAHSIPPSHSIWNNLLKKYVSKEGAVNYKGFIADKNTFEEYLNILSTTPSQASWSKEERLVYWINAYNAFTVKLIIDHYPVKSIKDIGAKLAIPGLNSVWDAKFITIGGKKYSLNNIEHGILRKKFNEPRIHFAVVCASYSCPPLRAEAYSAEHIERQLTEQTRIFLSDKRKNVISSDKLQISKIFSWFKGDFTKNTSLIDFLNKYTDTNISASAKMSHLSYDWQLNE